MKEAEEIKKKENEDLKKAQLEKEQIKLEEEKIKFKQELKEIEEKEKLKKENEIKQKQEEELKYEEDKRLFKENQKKIDEEDQKRKEDRNGNKESRAKVKNIMKILKDLDLDEPKIIKENNKISWISGKNSEKEGADVQNDWYGYFEGETVRFAKDKANQDIHSMSAPEYVLSQLKYLAEEKERKEEFINSKFYEKIDKINHQCLIGDVMNELAQKYGRNNRKAKK